MASSMRPASDNKPKVMVANQGLDALFQHRVARLVRKDGTVSYLGQRFELPYELSGKTVRLVVDPHAQRVVGAQLEGGLTAIAEAGRGLLLYLRQEGRGSGLVNKIRAYALQQAGADTVEANRLLGLPDDARDYTMAAAMLRQLGVARVRLLTNNPAKVEALQRLGIEVVDRLPLHMASNPHNQAYLRTKSSRMGHDGRDEPI